MKGNQAATYLVRLSDSDEALKYAKEAADAADGHEGEDQAEVKQCYFKAIQITLNVSILQAWHGKEKILNPLSNIRYEPFKIILKFLMDG